MKKYNYIIAITVLFISIAAFQFSIAQDNANQKDHVCTSACKGGKCVYAHGEKGHVCTDDCKALMTNTADNSKLKDHVCTSACKGGKCVYAHGEKGHVCTDDCLKK